MKLRTFVFGAVGIGSVFILLPRVMVHLNAACAWPRWESDVGRVVGGALMFGGIGVALYCSRLFARVGGGTPVPIEPPQRLVLSGLYRYSRNPIYVAEVAFLLGLFLHRGELSLLLYAILISGALHCWLIWREEPDLQRRFGEAYRRYMQNVPRWFVLRPRRRFGS